MAAADSTACISHRRWSSGCASSDIHHCMLNAISTIMASATARPMPIIAPEMPGFSGQDSRGSATARGVGSLPGAGELRAHAKRRRPHDRVRSGITAKPTLLTIRGHGAGFGDAQNVCQPAAVKAASEGGPQVQHRLAGATASTTGSVASRSRLGSRSPDEFTLAGGIPEQAAGVAQRSQQTGSKYCSTSGARTGLAKKPEDQSQRAHHDLHRLDPAALVSLQKWR